jgi:hypothetical protein
VALGREAVIRNLLMAGSLRISRRSFVKFNRAALHHIAVLHARSTLAVWLPLVEAPGNSAFGPLDLHFQKFLKPACLLGQKFFELLSLV